MIVVGVLLHSPWAREGGEAERSGGLDLRVLRCALSCRALLCVSVRKPRYKYTALTNWNPVPFRIHTVGHRNYFCTVLLGSAPFVEEHTHIWARCICIAPPNDVQGLTRLSAFLQRSLLLTGVARDLVVVCVWGEGSGWWGEGGGVTRCSPTGVGCSLLECYKE